MKHQKFLIVAAAGAALIVATGGCQVNRALEHANDARHLAADLHLQFTKAADASNLAVIADTDEAAAAFAKDASQRSASTARDAEQLAPLLDGLGYSEERQLLRDFQTRFAAYQKLDRTILDLAVENSNLKAQQLAFVSARDAADAVARALDQLQPARTSDSWHVKALAASVVARTREIEAVQPRHIAAVDDPTMDALEQRMTAAEQESRRELQALPPLIQPASKPRLAEASAALDRLMAVNQQIVTLSRRNSDVRSLALSLTEKRAVIADCEEKLAALQASLVKRGFASQGRYAPGRK